ncbi:hypothetical protein [Paraburkholderia elongata]|uniref:hypothetical protein n=1 Tax=Paraburkholderia elongata TaxID=2675747 RepID=UPI001556EB00|nr:hypothetical protein [Paraburkholderia elongata]
MLAENTLEAIILGSDVTGACPVFRHACTQAVATSGLRSGITSRKIAPSGTHCFCPMTADVKLLQSAPAKSGPPPGNRRRTVIEHK